MYLIFKKHTAANHLITIRKQVEVMIKSEILQKYPNETIPFTVFPKADLRKIFFLRSFLKGLINLIMRESNPASFHSLRHDRGGLHNLTWFCRSRLR
jgi:hypothetical protein